MKKNFTFLSLLLIISFGKLFSQSCISLGCASAHTAVTTDGNLPSIPVLDPGVDPPGTCYVGAPSGYKQIWWEFFFSPAGGDFVQGFSESAGGTTLDLDYVAYDVGTTAPLITCPIDITGWTELDCINIGSAAQTTGPGQPGGQGNTLTTTALHYYAIAIVVWQGVSNGGAASYQWDASAPTLGGLPLTIANCVDIALPVKLSSFTARANNCTVNLNWTADIETDFSNYEVQYSSDGKDFTTIASLPPQATSRNYSFLQNNPPQGKAFYRLRMVDIDGKSEFSKTIAMKLDCGNRQVFVYPNPVTDVLNINISNSQDNSTRAKLFDANGRLIYSNNMVSGTNTINMANLPKGIYLLQLINTTEVQNLKIIK
jgi:hypothetical protein